MGTIKSFKWLPIIMAVTIVGITVFQVYWLHNTYEREKRTLDGRTNWMFKETVWKLQASKLKIDNSLSFDSLADKRVAKDELSDKRIPHLPRQRMVGLMNVLKEKTKDSAGLRDVMVVERQMLSKGKRHGRDFPNNRLMQFLYEVDSLQDSIRLKDI